MGGEPVILYRLRKQFKENGKEIVEWFPTQEQVLSALKWAVKQGMRAKAEKMDVPTDKQGLTLAMNLAAMHADHWEAVDTLKSEGF
jgi:hypothetical protein